MDAHITQSLQLKRARRAAFAPFVMPLRLPSFLQVPGALILCALLGALALPNIAVAEFVFYVGNKEDLREKPELVGDGFCNISESTEDDSKCTLRAAIEEIKASSSPGSNCGVFDFANRVNLFSGTYTLDPRRLPLVIGRDDRDICVHLTGTTDNEGRAPVIDGNSKEGFEGTDRDPARNGIFSIRPRGRMSLDGVDVTKGHIHSIGGGAILNRGDLAIYNSHFYKNSTHGRGGAIYNEGNLWINQSTFSKNWSKPNYPEKDLDNNGNPRLDLDNDGQPDKIAGGAIANFGGSVLMYNVTVSGNLGGVDSRGGRTGVGDGGGGILNVGGGVIGMNNATVAYNLINGTSRSDNGAGIFNDKISTFNIWNTIVVNNYNRVPDARNDCKGVFGSFGYNLVESKPHDCTVNLGPGDIIGPIFRINPATGEVERHPVVGPLLQNGGPTPTHALLEASPAIDAGNPDPAGFGACAVTDQRYLPRPQDGPQPGYDGLAVCDIGAYEHGIPEISVGDVKLTEGNSGRKTMIFELVLSYPSVEPFSVRYTTADGSAEANLDYSPASGEAMFGTPHHGRTDIYVEIIGDRTKEPHETFFFHIGPATGAVRFKDDQAVGTILNDDK
jgi:hypothetical protein